MTAVPLTTFLRDRAQHIGDNIDTSKAVDLAVPRIHYESQDLLATASNCVDWRGEILMSALDAHGSAPDIAVGAVEFLVLRLGDGPVAEVLALHGERAWAFEELFDGEWLASDLDENEHFTAGMPISTVLLVLQAHVDPLISGSQLRAWAVAHVIHTMLPTTAGLVAMSAFGTRASAPRPARHLVSTDHLDPDWPRVGCTSIPGHPQFFGQSTAYRYLDDARIALDTTCRQQALRVPVAVES
ncbi:hypothetical protein MOKP106_42750 [Mycobacterium avium subsp. hominissuis]|uniref:hypothetical protein n=1 Tax=Mycobacterium avium TaxID=1764 RepID=UPI000AC552B8|nr:hypothetical protein [Mycobacterium avium]